MQGMIAKILEDSVLQLYPTHSSKAQFPTL